MTFPSMAHLPMLAPAVLLLLVALFGPAFSALLGLDPLRPEIGAALSAPSMRHWFGTDAIGRDIFARVLAAARLDLMMAFGGAGLAALIGITLGCCAALLGGFVDRIAQRSIDMLMAFPLFVVALALAAVLGNTIGSVVFATAVINVPFYMRLARAEFLMRHRAPYVMAARLAGWRESRIVATVLLPNMAPALIVQMTVNLGWAMLNGAGLSFLGIGIRPPTAEWGVMVAEGAGYVMTGQWWLVAFPGLALCLSVLALSVAGDALRDCFDPKRR